MEKIKNTITLHKIKIYFILTFLVIIFITSNIAILKTYKTKPKEIKISSYINEKYANEEETETIKVDIKGLVKNPGVYELKENSRVIDAINEAGGLLDSAYTRYINLSKKLIDENVIIINSKEEIESLKKTNDNSTIVCEPLNDVCIKEEIIENKNTFTKAPEQSNTKGEETLNIIVNINTASKEELMSLNGIGESKADLIIEYRNNVGKFKNIEEIKNIKGIGESIYAKIKDHIEV